METELRNSSAFFLLERQHMTSLPAYKFNRKKMVVTKYVNVPKVAQVGWSMWLGGSVLYPKTRILPDPS